MKRNTFFTNALIRAKRVKKYGDTVLPRSERVRASVLCAVLSLMLLCLSVTIYLVTSELLSAVSLFYPDTDGTHSVITEYSGISTEGCERVRTLLQSPYLELTLYRFGGSDVLFCQRATKGDARESDEDGLVLMINQSPAYFTERDGVRRITLYKDGCEYSVVSRLGLSESVVLLSSVVS